MQYPSVDICRRNQREAMCGQPWRILRDNGRVDTTAFHCGGRFCTHCSRVYSSRVASAIRETLDGWRNEGDGERSPTMLTLTERIPQPSAEEAWFVGGPLPEAMRRRAMRANLERAWQRIREHWAETRQTAARYISRRRSYRRHRAEAMCGDPLARYWRDEMRRRLDVAGLDQMPSPFDETWTEAGAYPGYRLPSTDDLTYIWAREVTRGGDGDRWHVHIHCIVPDRQTAELLNSAWQRTRRQRDFCQTDISEPGGVLEDAAADSIAEYVTQYVTGTRSCAFDDGWSEAERDVYRDFLCGRRLYGSAGAWRDLDVGRRNEEPEHEAIAVAWSDLDVWETFEEFYSKGSVVREAMTLASLAPDDPWVYVGDAVEAWSTIQPISALLEQHTNNSDNPLDEYDFEGIDDLPDETLRGGSARLDRLLTGG